MRLGEHRLRQTMSQWRKQLLVALKQILCVSVCFFFVVQTFIRSTHTAYVASHWFHFEKRR